MITDCKAVVDDGGGNDRWQPRLSGGGSHGGFLTGT
jgi:hypothetical protein